MSDGDQRPNVAKAYAEHQAELPRLPIPSLESTCEKLLKWSAPLLTEDELEESKEAVDEFLSNPNQGPELQQKLIDYDKENADKLKTGDSSGFATYFEEFWNHAYLAPKSSVVLNLNPFFVLEDDPRPIPKSRLQVVRAASLVFSSLKFVSDLRRGVMRPDMGRRNTRLCMSQFFRLFSTARIANSGCNDCIQVDEQATHVAVLCRGQFYYFDALWPTGQVAISEVELARNFVAILEDSRSLNAVGCAMGAVGVLTAEDRDQWGRCRTKLAALHPKNKKVLHIIDSALFVVCLDDCEPETLDDRAANMLHGSYDLVERTDAHEGLLQTGTLCNRWYDKLQLIICANGAAGINFEHSAVDGHTVLRFASDTFADTIVQFARSITYSTHGKDYLDPVCGKGNFFRPSVDKATKKVLLDTTPRKMDFVLNLDLRKAIHYSETKISDQILQNELRVLEFRTFGKQWMISRNVSPDAFVQLAMCTSYYILYGHFASQYESVMTKPFLHGRTEAGRSCTTEAAAFAQAWVDAATGLPGAVAAQVGGNNVAEHSAEGKTEEGLSQNAASHLRNLFMKAIKAQTSVVRDCARGHGVDRHLFGLKCQAVRKVSDPKASPHDRPADHISLFSCPAYTKLTSTVLSTSNCGNPSLQLFGFGPVSANGFGIGYIIKDNGIQFCICSKHRQTARYILTLKKFLRGMTQILQPEQRVAVSKYDGDAADTSETTDVARVHSAANRARLEQLASVGSTLDVKKLSRARTFSLEKEKREAVPPIRRSNSAWSSRDVHVPSAPKHEVVFEDQETLFGY